MTDDIRTEYKLLRKQLYNIKIKTNELTSTYEMFLKKIKDICYVNDNILYYSELIDTFNKLKCMNLKIDIIISSINSKI